MEDNGWVSVSERMPEVGDKTLLLFKDGHIESALWYDDGNGLYYVLYDGEILSTGITHWMPRPAPPNNSWDKISEVWEIGKND